MWGIRGVVGRWGWNVESPHILADSFRANKNGCRVSVRGREREEYVGATVVGSGRREVKTTSTVLRPRLAV